jgi:hypothetical protein
MTKARDLSQVPNASLGFKNRIINGDMRIDQRNAGASVTPTTDSTYTLDRFKVRLSQGSKFSVQQNAGAVTPPVGFTNYLGITSLSSYSSLTGDYFGLMQNIEGFNTADWGFGTASATPITMSFWVRSSLTGQFSGLLYNEGNTRNYTFVYTINSVNTWEYKTITIPGDTGGTWATNNGNGLQIWWDLGSGSSYTGSAQSWTSSFITRVTGSQSLVGTNGATFYITGVQLEKGSTATSFDYRPYGTELQLCQRYYEKSFNQNTAPANGPNGTSFATGSNPVSVLSQGLIVNASYRFFVVKRAAPTLIYYGNSTGQVAVASTSGPVVWTAGGSINGNANEIGINAYNFTSVFQHITFAYAASAEL